MQSQFRTLAPDFAVAPQISQQDVAAAAADGVVLIVNNRPDGEEPGQPAGAEIEAAARAAGVAYAAIPVDHRGFSMTQLEQLNAAAAEHAGRTLAYCRSGTRSAMLWALTQAKFGDNDVSEILEAAASAGYDASPLARQLEALRQNG